MFLNEVKKIGLFVVKSRGYKYISYKKEKKKN